MITKIECSLPIFLLLFQNRFEMIVQADEYERAQPNQDLTDFFQSTQGAFQHPQVVAWDEELRRQRDAKPRKDEKEG